MESCLNAASIKDSQSFGVMGEILADNDDIDSAVSTTADSVVVLVAVLTDDTVESL